MCSWCYKVLHFLNYIFDNVALAITIEKFLPVFKRRRVVDIATVTDVQEAKKLLELGWEYNTSYPATIANIPHYILVKREKSQ
jgi:hypothetical protein